MAYLLKGSDINIGFETLKMKCTQYGICEQVAFKNASTLVFSKSGGRRKNVGGCPLTEYSPPKSSWGGT